MLFEAVIGLIFGVVRGVLALIPDGTPPDWIDTGADYLVQVVAYASGLGAFIPFDLAGAVLTAVILCSVIGFGVLIVRMALSLFTGGGGST